MPRLHHAGMHLSLGRCVRAAASVVLAVGLTAPSGAAHAVGGSEPAAGWRATMLALANSLRAEAGVPALMPCPSLRRAAQGYATLMATTGTFGHVGPDGSQPWDRMREQGFQWRAAAENIALGQQSVRSAMRAWVSSSGHLANLLDPRMTRVGFGYAVSDSGGIWVQDFGAGSGC